MRFRLNLLYLLCSIICLFISCTTDIHKTESFRDIFDFYRNQEGVMAFSFPPSLIGLILDQGENDDDEMVSLMKDLSAFRIISLKDTGINQNITNDMFQVINDFTIRNGFNDFFVVRSSEENIIIRVMESEDMISEAIIMFSEDNGLTVINLKGNIKPENVAKLIDSEVFQDLEELYSR